MSADPAQLSLSGVGTKRVPLFAGSGRRQGRQLLQPGPSTRVPVSMISVDESFQSGAVSLESGVRPGLSQTKEKTTFQGFVFSDSWHLSLALTLYFDPRSSAPVDVPFTFALLCDGSFRSLAGVFEFSPSRTFEVPRSLRTLKEVVSLVVQKHSVDCKPWSWHAHLVPYLA